MNVFQVNQMGKFGEGHKNVGQADILGKGSASAKAW